MPAILRYAALTLLALVVAGGLAATIVPRYLDRVYYRGPATDHFDGTRFFNPDGDADTLRLPSGGGRLGFFWRQLTGSDGRPPWPDRVKVEEPLLPPRVYADNRNFLDPKTRVHWGRGGLQNLGDLGFTPPFCDQNARADNMLVTWIGHATVLVQTNGLNILTDPVWSERTGPFGRGPKRVAEPGVRFEDLPKIDLILLSHNHYDHLDLPTLERLWRRDKPRIVTSLGNDAILRSRGIEAEALDWGQETGITRRGRCPPTARCALDATVHVTRNHHWGSRWFSDRNRALWSSFVVKLPGGNIFFAGDTGMGDGRWPAEAAAYGPIRLALIPIGAFRFVPGQMASGSHIGPVDAVEVHRRLGASTSIPIHWGTFRLSYEGRDTPPRLLDAVMRASRQGGFRAVRIGEPVEVAPYAPPAPAPEVPRAKLLRRLDTPEVRAMR